MSGIEGNTADSILAHYPRWAAVTEPSDIDEDVVGPHTREGLSGSRTHTIHGGRLLPRRFALVRHVDYTGISGVGVVAYGVVFPDGHVALRWASGHPATSLWTSMHDVIAVHGHGDATSIEWLDRAEDTGGNQTTNGGRRARRTGPIPSPEPAPPAEDPSAPTPAASQTPARPTAPPPAPPADSESRVPPQRGTGRHRRPTHEQEGRMTQPIESDRP